MRLLSAISGVLLLSFFPHQEARFLIPAVPLILSSIRLPKNHTRAWLASWVIFNVAMGVLMGVYHQGGIVPAQNYLARTDEDLSHVQWWKTYSPPIWLLNGKNEHLDTIDLMGISGPAMLGELSKVAPCENPPLISRLNGARKGVYLVAPRSAYFLKPYAHPNTTTKISLEEVWSYRRHLNLDDLDFGDDGVWPTLRRVVGDRGLVVYRAKKTCG
jgi:phosphatidylinositol glycan class Z